jgi:hypothetical protein
MKSTKNPIERLIRKETDKSFRPANFSLNTIHQNLNYFELMNSKFSPVPINIAERTVRMKSIKSKMDLTILNKINNKCVLNNARVGEDRDALIFSKVNPISGVNPNFRPNFMSWNEEQFNRRIVGKMIIEHEDYEKCNFLFIFSTT